MARIAMSSPIAATARARTKIEDIEACEKAVPKPQRGSSVRNGFFRKDEFCHGPDQDVFICPAKETCCPLRMKIRLHCVARILIYATYSYGLKPTPGHRRTFPKTYAKGDRINPLPFISILHHCHLSRERLLPHQSFRNSKKPCASALWRIRSIAFLLATRTCPA